VKVVHTFSAFNTAKGVENPLHNDCAARKLGYRAGLIAGAAIYGHMTYAAVQRWGLRWLEAGTAECVLLKPVYEGDPCEVIAEQDDGPLPVALRANGQICARAEFSVASAQTPPDADGIPWRPEYPSKPVAGPESLANGIVLPTVGDTLDDAAATRYLLDVRDDLAVYAAAKVLHPGYLLRLCNFTLSRNLVLGPWIHTASHVRNFSTVPVGVPIQARGRVRSNYERRGHLMVDVDVHLVVKGEYVACAVTHSAIYQTRQQ
jgi:hypothetical protein